MHARVVEAPLSRVGVVEAQRNASDATRWAGNVEFDQVGAAIKQFSHDAGAVEFDPFGRTTERMEAARDMLAIRRSPRRGARAVPREE